EAPVLAQEEPCTRAFYIVVAQRLSARGHAFFRGLFVGPKACVLRPIANEKIQDYGGRQDKQYERPGKGSAPAVVCDRVAGDRPHRERRQAEGHHEHSIGKAAACSWI